MIDREESSPAAGPSIKRRGLLKVGAWITAITGATAAIANAAASDVTQPRGNVPLEQENLTSASAASDSKSKLANTQTTDLAPAVTNAQSAAIAEQTAEYSLVVAGAVGDGITDDRAYIQGLIDDAAAQYALGASFATRRVVIQLPRGQWAIGSSLSLKTGVRLRGVGEASVIKALPRLDATPLIIGDSEHAVEDAVIEDLTLDGSYFTTAAARTGIQVTNGARIAVRRVHLKDFGGAGVTFQGLGAGGGTPDSQVIDCTFDRIGLSDGTTGFGILFKDNSQRCIARGNIMKNIKGGMGIGGKGSADTGHPIRCIVTNNIISMAASKTGFEAVGWTSGCDFWQVSANQIYDSQDNGISASGSYAHVFGNTIDGAQNHGIASAGHHSHVTGNFIRNVGKQNPDAHYAFISATSTTGNFLALNKGIDDQAAPTTAHGVKFNMSGGQNIVFANIWTGNSGADISGDISSDLHFSLSGNVVRTSQVATDTINASTGEGAILVGSTIQMRGRAYTGSGRLGSGQHIMSTDATASRPAHYCYSHHGQDADISQWATTAADNTSQTVRAGVTATGRIYSSEGFSTKDLGAIDGLTSAQIDALFSTAPSDGTLAVGTLSTKPVILHRYGGMWNYSSAIRIT